MARRRNVKASRSLCFERNAANREKKVDTQLTADVVSDLYDWIVQGRDEVRIVAGDADYVPVVEKVQSRGLPCIVVFWDHAARALKEAATDFISLDPYPDDLRRD